MSHPVLVVDLSNLNVPPLGECLNLQYWLVSKLNILESDLKKMYPILFLKTYTISPACALPDFDYLLSDVKFSLTKVC